MTKLRNWQLRELTVLENKLGNPRFYDAIQDFKKSNLENKDGEFCELDRAYAFEGIVTNFNIPTHLEDCLWSYLENGKLDPERILPSLRLISELDHTVEPSKHNIVDEDWDKYDHSREPEVKLVLSAATTRRELEDFIETYWALIEKRLKKLPNQPERIRPKPKSERDLLIWQLYQNGYEYKEIAHQVNDRYQGRDNHTALTKEYVRRIVSRMRERFDAEQDG